LGKDPENDKLIVAQTRDLASKKGGAEGAGMMKALKAVSEYNGAIKQSTEQKKVFFERLGKLDEMIRSGASEYDISGLITDMTAMGDQINGHYQTKLNSVLQRQKLTQNELKITGSVMKMKNDADKLELAKRGLYLREQAIEFAKSERMGDNEVALLKYVAELDKKGVLNKIEGLPEGTSYQDAANFLKKEIYDDGTAPEFE
jgi:hypothetical protein